MSTVKSRPASFRARWTSASISSSVVPRSSRRWIARPSIAIAADALSESIVLPFPPSSAAAVVALATSPAMADGIVDNVNGITVADGGRVIHFKAILIDKDGRVTRLVPPGEEAPKAKLRRVGA